jgi:hypothetical protein
MPFKPGQSGNPKGRRPGIHSAETKLALEEALASAKVDPVEFLSQVVSAEKLGLPFRLQAAGLLLPYRRRFAGRWGDGLMDCLADAARLIAVRYRGSASLAAETYPCLLRRRSPSILSR